MAVPLIVRKTLKRMGLLESAQSLKRIVAGAPQYYDFKPADPRSQIATLICFDWLRQRSLLEGTDYFEFGIFRGFNLWFVRALARAYDVADMRFVGFDSFFGLPAVEGSFEEGEFSAYREEVQTYLDRYPAGDPERTILVEGVFNESLNPETVRTHGLRRCALCVVDCDLYMSTVPVLSFVAPLLAPTSVIYFDDWNDFGADAAQGEQKAFSEFMAVHREEFSAEPLRDLRSRGGKGVAFVLRRLTPLVTTDIGAGSPR